MESDSHESFTDDSMREDTKEDITYMLLDPVSVCEEDVSPPNSDTTVVDNPSNLVSMKLTLALLKVKRVNCLLNSFLGILAQIVQELYQKRLKLHVTG